MKIAFVNTEARDPEFFRDNLPDHDLDFPSSLIRVADDCEILSVFVHDQVDEIFLNTRHALRMIATRSTGYDHLDLSACRARNILISNVPTYGENTVAEHAFALILALSRRLQESILAAQQPDFSAAEIRGFDLKGNTLGAIGTGRIGLHAIRMARGFGMNVVAFDVAPQHHLADLLGFQYLSLNALLESSHVVSIHCPLTPDNFHLLDRAKLAKCRRGVLIINTARGGLIDTDALTEALDSGIVGGAGLDVLEDELTLIRGQSTTQAANLQPPTSLEEAFLKDPAKLQEIKHVAKNRALIARPNVIFTPHIAYNSVEAVRRINQTTVHNIQVFLRGEPANVV
ncbi:MAG: NAD(P)-dependent oxidoreductase [Chthoniobacterales bacterium]